MEARRQRGVVLAAHDVTLDKLNEARAECERLRACVEAADAMRGSYLSRYIDEYDTARAAIDAGRKP